MFCCGCEKEFSSDAEQRSVCTPCYKKIKEIKGILLTDHQAEIVATGATIGTVIASFLEAVIPKGAMKHALNERIHQRTHELRAVGRRSAGYNSQTWQEFSNLVFLVAPAPAQECAQCQEDLKEFFNQER